MERCELRLSRPPANVRGAVAPVAVRARPSRCWGHRKIRHLGHRPPACAQIARPSATRHEHGLPSSGFRRKRRRGPRKPYRTITSARSPAPGSANAGPQAQKTLRRLNRAACAAGVISPDLPAGRRTVPSGWPGETRRYRSSLEVQVRQMWRVHSQAHSSSGQKEAIAAQAQTHPYPDGSGRSGTSLRP